jgi:hypothetical protein
MRPVDLAKAQRKGSAQGEFAPVSARLPKPLLISLIPLSQPSQPNSSPSLNQTHLPLSIKLSSLSQELISLSPLNSDPRTIKLSSHVSHCSSPSRPPIPRPTLRTTHRKLHPNLMTAFHADLPSEPGFHPSSKPLPSHSPVGSAPAGPCLRLRARRRRRSVSGPLQMLKAARRHSVSKARRHGQAGRQWRRTALATVHTLGLFAP